MNNIRRKKNINEIICPFHIIFLFVFCIEKDKNTKLIAKTADKTNDNKKKRKKREKIENKDKKSNYF